MEPLGAISELNWNFPDESEVIMAQLLGAYSDMNEQDHEASFGIDRMFFPGQGATSSCSFLDNLASCWLDASNTTSSFFFPSSEFQSYELGDSNTVSANSMDYFTSEEQMTSSSHMVGAEYQVEDLICSKDRENENEPKDYVTNTNADDIVLSDHTSEAKRKFLEPENRNSTESPKKKARVQAQKSTKNARSKKAQKNTATGEEALSNASCSSEDESITSQELTEGAASSAKGKTRAGRGSATDPQSLYARKRRERINERLRILQNLVPNGTKVDISTMLEEAVQYVKFLQLQIKLLSSDDMWMYAPLAYNGMDIGLDLKIPPPRQ